MHLVSVLVLVSLALSAVRAEVAGLEDAGRHLLTVTTCYGCPLAGKDSDECGALVTSPGVAPYHDDNYRVYCKCAPLEADDGGNLLVIGELSSHPTQVLLRSLCAHDVGGDGERPSCAGSWVPLRWHLLHDTELRKPSAAQAVAGFAAAEAKGQGQVPAPAQAVPAAAHAVPAAASPSPPSAFATQTADASTSSAQSQAALPSLPASFAAPARAT